MDKLLRILHLEDDPEFTALVSAVLEKDGLRTQISLATDYSEFVAALEGGSFDIVLADYCLPTCNGLEALEATRQKCPETPFLLISGTHSELAAIKGLNCGATGYVSKDGLECLAPAVRRAVQESRLLAKSKHAHDDLAPREKYFRALTESSLDVVTVVGRDGVFQYNSPSLKSILGFDPIELAGRNVFELVHPEDLSNAFRLFERMLNHPELRVTLSSRLRHCDGSWRDIEAIGQNRLDVPEIAGIVMNLRGNSHRRCAEAELHESERRFREWFEGSPDAVVVADSQGAIMDINPAGCRLWCAGHAKLIGRNIASQTPRNRDAKAGPLEKLVAGTIGRIEAVIVVDDGSEVPVEVTGNCIEYRDQQAMLLHVRDISGRLRAVEALKQSEASLVDAERIAHLGSWEMDFANPDAAGLGSLRWSDETHRIFGLKPRQVTVSHDLFFEFVHPEDRQRVKEALRQATQENTAYDIEHRIVRPDGEERVLRERGELALDANGKPAQMRGIVMDVTDRKHLEEQLRQSQKMEAIGQLAGGVAHDFNNILTVIHGHASLILRDPNHSESMAKSARQIAQAVERAAGLTRQLLAFSRRQVMQPQRLDLNEAVSNMTRMLGRILGEDIALHLNFSTQAACVHADASMIEQVLLNLAVNARDAMPKGGQLAIKIAVVKVSAGHRAVHPESRAGEFVCLSAVDTGCGIAPETLPRIFEPFFTTKEVGKGTGLGLATVYGIVKQHHGWVEAKSELGRGAAFEVYLPVSQGPATPTDHKPADEAPRGGRETILLVEDEMPVRELARAILEGHGYKILQAESGTKALELWQQMKDKVDMLLTDIVMPDRINGRELAELLRKDRPSLNVLFTSGYSADVVGKDFFSQPGLRYLQKPYDPQKLARAVRECLDARV